MWCKKCIHKSERYLVNVVSNSVKNMKNNEHLLTPNEQYEIKKIIEKLKTPKKYIADIQKYK